MYASTLSDSGGRTALVRSGAVVCLVDYETTALVRTGASPGLLVPQFTVGLHTGSSLLPFWNKGRSWCGLYALGLWVFMRLESHIISSCSREQRHQCKSDREQRHQCKSDSSPYCKLFLLSTLCSPFLLLPNSSTVSPVLAYFMSA